MTVKGGGGNDTFNVGYGGLIDGLSSTLTVDGGGGTDTLTIDDGATTIPGSAGDHPSRPRALYLHRQR